MPAKNALHALQMEIVKTTYSAQERIPVCQANVYTRGIHVKTSGNIALKIKISVAIASTMAIVTTDDAALGLKFVNPVPVNLPPHPVLMTTFPFASRQMEVALNALRMPIVEENDPIVAIIVAWSARTIHIAAMVCASITSVSTVG
jgi:hypothetical protein